MKDSVIPVMVSHGEGQAKFEDVPQNVIASYVDPSHNASKIYPFNPNGSHEGVAGVCNDDGRIMIMMPHPERAVDKELGSISGLRMFESVISNF